MTFERLAELVAEEFKKEMVEHDCDTFDEMVDLFWWTPTEIKDEVDYIIRNVEGVEGLGAYIDELDRTEVFIDRQSIPYRKFARMWRKALGGHND